jgi:anhydro-N-acetylmuramic acid kinase
LQHLGQPYDADGAWAATGKVVPALLADLLNEPYFDLPAPKSTGRDLFHADWLNSKLASHPRQPRRRAGDADAADGRQPGAGHRARRGAGGKRVCVRRRRAECQPDGGPGAGTAGHGGGIDGALGVAPSQVEALAFAWLAWRFTQRKPGNLPAVTGAQGLRVLGALYPR